VDDYELYSAFEALGGRLTWDEPARLLGYRDELGPVGSGARPPSPSAALPAARHAGRAQALVHAPAALRRRGVFVADYEIDAA